MKDKKYAAEWFDQRAKETPMRGARAMFEIAADALKKQIPKKPFPYKGFDGKCVCGVVFLDRSTNYCGNCGQALDWSDTE